MDNSTSSPLLEKLRIERARRRTLEAEVQMWRNKANENHKQVMGMREGHKKRLAETQALRKEVRTLRAQLENQ